jgi:hypothetical protein
VHITPILILDGEDVSRYFLTSHSEQTGNSSKDPGKYDVTLANVGGRFTGSFAPKSIEELSTFELTCKSTTITGFGQKVTLDDDERIEPGAVSVTEAA